MQSVPAFRIIASLISFAISRTMRTQREFSKTPSKAKTPIERKRKPSALSLCFISPGSMPRRDGPCKSISDPCNNSSRLIQSFGPDAGTDSIGDWPQAERMGHFWIVWTRRMLFPKPSFTTTTLRTILRWPRCSETFSARFRARCSSGRWWHLDQRDGMEEQLKTLANLGLLSRFVGCSPIRVPSFPSPPRIFPENSVQPAWNWMKDGFVPNEPEMIGDLVKRICYSNAREYLNLGE